MEEECIFVDKPKECEICLRSHKLRCLLNKRHLLVRQEAKLELVTILYEFVDSPERYKRKSGEAGRKRD